MTGDLIINGLDAYNTWGVCMTDGFLDTLCESNGLKDYITNDSRLEDGVRYSSVIPKVTERQITLVFTIIGASTSDYKAKKKAFEEVMYAGDVTINVPSDSTDIYHLKFKGSTGAYAQNRSKTFGKIGLKFTEPNPKNRT